MESGARWARPRISARDIAWIVLPLLLWIGATNSRSRVLTPYCGSKPALCTRESVPAFDRAGIGLEDPDADWYSYAAQNLSGALAVVVPLAWNASLALMGTLTPMAAGAAIGVDVLLFSETWSWNGFLTEASHLLSGRPRPFVYTNPAGRGLDPAHYTSFYSGHTSFSACCLGFILLTLLARGAPRALILGSGLLSGSLVFLTGIFRVLAGRHFPSDVVTASVAGLLVAYVIARRHQPRC